MYRGEIAFAQRNVKTSERDGDQHVGRETIGVYEYAYTPAVFC